MSDRSPEMIVREACNVCLLHTRDCPVSERMGQPYTCTPCAMGVKMGFSVDELRDIARAARKCALEGGDMFDLAIQEAERLIERRSRSR